MEASDLLSYAERAGFHLHHPGCAVHLGAHPPIGTARRSGGGALLAHSAFARGSQWAASRDLELTPQASPTTTSIPRPLGPVEEYQVEAGDTLGLIAEEYDVSVEDIMRVNQITDPNSLAVGMVLYIPLQGDDVPTVTARPSLPPQVSSTPSGPPVEARGDH